MSNGSNDILIGLDNKDVVDDQARRLQDLGLDLDLLGIGDEKAAKATTKNDAKLANNAAPNSRPIEDLKELNNIFMKNQFGHVSSVQQR